MQITKQQLDTIMNNAPKGVDKEELQMNFIKAGHTIEGVDTEQAKAYIAQKEAGFPPQAVDTEPKLTYQAPDGILKTIAKDVANTLVVKPVARATEAVTRLVVPESDATKGYEMMSDSGESQNIGGMEVSPIKAFGEGGGRQIAGETLKVGSYLFPYGKVAQGVGGALLGASKLTPLAVKSAKVAGQVISGATGGYLTDVGNNLTDENKTLGELFIPGMGTALGAVIPLAGTGIKAIKGVPKTSENVTKRVLQGQTKDIPLAEQAFKHIDTTGVKTRQELSSRLQNAMDNQMNIVDEHLAKDSREIPLNDYVIRMKNNAGQEVKTDVISNALSHLQDFYTQAGDNLSASNVGLIKDKAVSQGLTHQEVNNIARMYSEEFGTKAFNKVGDPLTSVNAQMSENTRNGLKQASRGGLGYGAEAKQADQLYSAMRNTKRLIDVGVEKVNSREAKLKDRNILQQLSYSATKAINALTGGSLKSAVEALGVSNVGNKIDNWVNLENSLKKDLEFIQKANTTKSDKGLIKIIEDYAKKLQFPGDKAVNDINTTVKQVKNTPNKKGGFIKVGKSNNISSSISKAKASGQSFDEWVSNQKAEWDKVK